MAKFEFIKNEIEGLVVIKPTVFGDDRGFFMETFHKEEFAAAGITREFVQDNHSKSSKGVLRGLHFQKEFPQGKLVRVVKGSVFDVAVDLRKDSPTYKQHYIIHLSGENQKQFLIPRGFAHGFVVLSETALFSYKCDNVYNKESEGAINPFDEELNINWEVNKEDVEIIEQKTEKQHEEQIVENSKEELTNNSYYKTLYNVLSKDNLIKVFYVLKQILCLLNFRYKTLCIK